MGEMEVPADALYGASTQRAVLNFPISGERMPRRFLRALALIKLAAAQTNAELGLLDPDVADAIAAAAASVADGDHDDAVPDRRLPDRLGDLDQHEHERGRRQPGRAPARRAAGRSTPTTRSTAARARTTSSRRRSSCRPRWPSRRTCCPALERLHTALVAKEQAFWPVIKTGRTHLQDATPIRLGQEFRGYAGQVEESIRRARAAQAELLEVPLGGTAVGTGINAHPEYAFRTCARLSALTGLTVRETGNHFHAQSTLDAADRRPRRDPDDRAQPVEDRLGRPADGDGPASRDRRAGPPRDAAGLEHHAGQGEPGHRREPDDGRRQGRRQRRDRRLRADRELPRAQRHAAR